MAVAHDPPAVHVGVGLSDGVGVAVRVPHPSQRSRLSPPHALATSASTASARSSEGRRMGAHSREHGEGNQGTRARR
jgi:hypothetical protein